LHFKKVFYKIFIFVYIRYPLKYRPINTPGITILEMVLRKYLPHETARSHYANIARDCGIDAKTVKEYYQILVDTLLGTMIEPYKKRQDRNVIIRAGKFHLFDVGVAGTITHRQIPQEKGDQFGKALEHFILMEILAHRAYRELYYDVNFWRTKEIQYALHYVPQWLIPQSAGHSPQAGIPDCWPPTT
jgi:predicted AAA+ superfamily ATPase